jgi:radical SAM protein with 4Fe4S-binding SPASM domain
MNLKPIGNIWEKRTLLEMAHSQNTLPQLANHGVLDYNTCKSCQWALTCGGGCPVVNADTYGTPLTASPYCDLFRTMIPRLIHLKALTLVRALTKV